jgi:imidazolonepropionase-like amidohydrolase
MLQPEPAIGIFFSPKEPPMDDNRFARRLAPVALLVAAAAACVAPGPPAAAQEGVIVFRNVNVIPMDSERVLADQTVIVRDGRIAQIAPAAEVAVPQAATVVDGTGKYLLPGMAEMHAHIPTPQGGQAAVDRTLFLYLAGGVTTIRGMLGHPSHLELRERSARNEIAAPRIYTSGPSFSGGSASDPAAAAAMVRQQKEAGYDFLKLHPGLSRAAFDAIVAAADDVDIPFAGHVSAEVGLARALEAEYASIDHLDAYVEALAGHLDGFGGVNAGFFGFNLTDRADAGRIAELAEATEDADVWNVPTQSLMESLAGTTPTDEMARWPEMRYMPPATVEDWVERKRDFRAAEGYTPERAQRYLQIRRQLIKALHDAGARLILGSDAPQWWNVPGFSARRELEYMVTAGLTPFQALQMATTSAAEYFDAEDEWGTVTTGRSADLILLDANPLQDITNLWQQSGVMVRGRWLPGDEIQRRLDEIATQVGS